MSNPIRDLGAGKDYTLAVSVSDAGVELTADASPDDRGEIGRDDFSHTVILKTESVVLDLIRALGAACKKIASGGAGPGPAFFERTTAPRGASVYAVDSQQDSFVIQTGAGEFFDLSLTAVEMAIDEMRARKTAKTGEELLRERAVSALFKLGRHHGAGSFFATEADEKRSISKILAELVEYLSVKFEGLKRPKAETRPTGSLQHDRDVAAAFEVSIAEKPAPAPVLPVEDPRVTDYPLDRDAYPTLAYWLSERSGIHSSAQQEIRDLLRHARADAVRFVSDAKASELQAAATSALNTLRDEALRIAVEHGFTDATIGEDLMLMVSELAEALEDHRAGRKPDEIWYEAKTPQKDADATVRYRFDEYAAGLKPAGIPSEMADVLIRVFHFCGKHGIDIDKAVREKMAFNSARPMRHGGKKL